MAHMVMTVPTIRQNITAIPLHSHRRKRFIGWNSTAIQPINFTKPEFAEPAVSTKGSGRA
jgi:hypothetical protein